MPNWWENELTVTGPSEELTRFRDYARARPGEREERVLSEEPFIPYPERFRELDRIAQEYEQTHAYDRLHPEDWQNRPRDGFNQGGYEWCLQNWGAKWGFCKPTLVADDPDRLEYRFDTAWSTPVPRVRKMSGMFPSLKFELNYWEGGAGFRGTLIAEGGQPVAEDVNSYAGPRGG